MEDMDQNDMVAQKGPKSLREDAAAMVPEHAECRLQFESNRRCHLALLRFHSSESNPAG